MHTLLIKRYKDLNIYQPNLMASKVRFSPFTSCMNQPMSDLTKYLIEFLFVSLLCSRGIKIIYFKNPGLKPSLHFVTCPCLIILLLHNPQQLLYTCGEIHPLLLAVACWLMYM